MTRMRARHIITLVYFLPTIMFAQKKHKLTADQIIDASITFCGGEARISKIKTVQTIYLLIQPDQSTATIDDKLKTGEKYVQSILSKNNSPQTTFFNGEKISRVDGNSVIHITDIPSKKKQNLKHTVKYSMATKNLTINYPGYLITNLQTPTAS